MDLTKDIAIAAGDLDPGSWMSVESAVSFFNSSGEEPVTTIDVRQAALLLNRQGKLNVMMSGGVITHFQRTRCTACLAK